MGEFHNDTFLFQVFKNTLINILGYKMKMAQPPFQVTICCNPPLCIDLGGLPPPLQPHTVLTISTSQISPCFDLDLGEGHATLVCHPSGSSEHWAAFPDTHSSDEKCKRKHPGVTEPVKATPAVCFSWLNQNTHNWQMKEKDERKNVSELKA